MPSQTITNQDLVDIFRLIGNLLEVKGEVIFKILAYRRAADSLENLPEDVHVYWKAGRLSEIPGVGKAIAEKIDELLTTGRLEFLEKLEQEIPPSIVEVLEVPDVGPKKATLFWKELGISNLAQLSAAAQAGQLRSLPGMGEKSEAKILAGIEAVKRRSGRIPLGKAWPFAQEMLAYLQAIPGVSAVSTAGSLRRMRSTVGDLDLLAAAADSRPVIEAFVNHPDVLAVSGQGEVKASLEFKYGIRAQLWVLPPERWGTALQYATGSKDHNVRLREIAIKQGLSLSDQALTRTDGTEILAASEEQVYQILGLPWIPPELREDRGEIQAARAGQLPGLIQSSELLAELHSHSTWSDGKASIQSMAQAAHQRGYRVLAITDHSASLGVAGGLSIDELKAQRIEIDQVQKQMGEKLILLQGAEVEILADGTLDYPDESLAELDVVIASLHTGLRQPREQVTRRLLNAINNPHVDIIGHPTGRMIPNREGADLDMTAVLEAAAHSGVALEINAHPSRLDLDDVTSRRARELGIPITINTDAHSPADLDMAFFGVATARRGWVETEGVINTWPAERLQAWLRSRTAG